MTLDIAIIGASSSGLYTARDLARGGRRVAVFERSPTLDPARRTLIITPQLYSLIDDLPPDVLLHRIPVMRVATPRALAEVRLKEADLIIERGALTCHLARQAQNAGAELHLGHRFLSVEPHPEGAALHFRTAGGTQQVTARLVIGADGVTSDVARAAGLALPPRVPILQAEVNLPWGWDPAVTQVWFDVGKTKYFYWLIPETADRGVAGLVGDGRQATQDLLNIFLDRLGLQPLAFQGAQVAMHHPRLRPWGNVGNAPVMLVGDAAGQVKVTTVGGTVSGLWGARAASQAILAGQPYARTLRSLKRELDLHWAIRWLLERQGNAGYDRLVQALNPAVLRFLSQYNRDAMAGVIWKLPLLQPRLLGVGLTLLRGHDSGARLLEEKLPLTESGD